MSVRTFYHISLRLAVVTTISRRRVFGAQEFNHATFESRDAVGYLCILGVFLFKFTAKAGLYIEGGANSLSRVLRRMNDFVQGLDRLDGGEATWTNLGTTVLLLSGEEEEVEGRDLPDMHGQASHHLS